jgi:ADP-ribose pyrophosphatase
VIYRGKFFEYVSRGKWEYVRRPNAAGGVAVIIPVTKDNELLLVEQYRAPLASTVLELPAGLVGDKDIETGDHETLLAGAVRELEEETGYRAQNPNSDFELVLSGPSSAGMSNEIITFFLAKNLTKFEEVRLLSSRADLRPPRISNALSV